MSPSSSFRDETSSTDGSEGVGSVLSPPRCQPVLSKRSPIMVTPLPHWVYRCAPHHPTHPHAQPPPQDRDI